MSEEKKMIKFCIIVFVIGVLGVLLVNSIGNISFSDVVVKNYEANLYIGRDLTLEESYNYELLADNKYRMLYRDWKASLVYNDNPKFPHVEVLNLTASSKDMVGYVVDYDGRVYAFSNNNLIKKEIKYLIYEYNVVNEVGFYNPHRYDAGSYITNYRFYIYPPIETDDKVSHINLKLTDKHLPYKNVKINVIDKNHSILNLFIYPSTFKVHKTDVGYVIEGSSPKNEPISIEMLLKPNTVNGFINHINNVEEKTISAYKRYILIN